MEIKTSKVKSAQPTGRTWSSNGQTYHVHSIEMENGDKGEYSSKSPNQDKLKVGEEANYEYHPATGNFPPKIKPKQAEKFERGGYSGGKNGHGNVASFALSYSKDIYIAYNSTIKDKEFTLDHLFTLADRMHDWLKNKEV